MNTYDLVLEQYNFTGYIDIRRFSESQLQEVFDAAPAGSDFEQALQDALSILM